MSCYNSNEFCFKLSGETSKDEGEAEKDKKEKAQSEAATAEPDLVPSIVLFSFEGLRKAILHPDADSLYVSTVDLGEAEPRTVVSGLVKYIPQEDMQNRRVVCVCNLKPAAMRGIKSSAMVLAASPHVLEGQVKDMVELVIPPDSSAAGDTVYGRSLSLTGHGGNPCG